MSDLISREEVLKIVKDTMKLYKWTDLVCDWGKGACEEIEEAIKKLPFQWNVEVIHWDKIKYPSQNGCKPLPQPPLLDK